jgi:small subunit ribosomal protein S15
MALQQGRKQEIITDYQTHETDTGSADVQIAILTEKINRLSLHLRTNKKDHGSRQGLLRMISQRKRLLAYVLKHEPERYRSILTSLGLRG